MITQAMVQPSLWIEVGIQIQKVRILAGLISGSARNSARVVRCSSDGTILLAIVSVDYPYFISQLADRQL